MNSFDLLAWTVPVLLLLLGAYVVRQARRSRESELTYRLRKCEIALHDAEQALDNTVYYYKRELGRVNGRQGGRSAGAASHNGNRAGADLAAGDPKFRQVKKAFARLYHPDQICGDPLEKRIRIELFKEFWDELERIERRNP